MNLKELLESFDAQGKNFEELHQILQAKKNALISNDNEQLDEVLKKEQTLLRTIDKEDKKRRYLVETLATENSVDLKENSMDELFNSLKGFPPSELEKLRQIRSTLKKKAGEVIHINSQLSVMIDVSRGIVKETMVSLLGKGKKIVNKRV